ncbi:MAG: MATE family efflux transporter [Ruminococcaceae bacterium]|nr:MATE family efflux transporter [Oscillospiraceae bacterium]
MNTTDAYYQKMTKTPVSRLIITLGIPTTISMLVTNIYNMVDTYFVGSLGESQQAATGILFTLQAIIQAISFMLGQGSGTMVSKSLADKNTKEASEYVSTGFFTGATLGALLTVVGLIFLEPFMRVLGSTETILPYAMDYGLWVLISCPFMVCSFVLNNNLRYEGKAAYAMVGLVTGAVLNIFGDYLLIRVIPWGVFGAGCATAVSQIISFFILLFFHNKHAQGKIRFRYISKRKNVYFTIAKVGFPALIRQGLSSISSGLLNNLTKPFGDAAIAAMSVVNRFSALVMCVGLGVGQGFQPVASFNYQAGKYKRVKKALLFTMGCGFTMIICFALPGMIFPEQIVGLFQEEQAVRDIGGVALRYASFGVIFLALSVPINMLYQSIRKPGMSSFLSLLRSGLAFIPVLLLTSSLWGITGIQISQPIADMLTGLISIPFIIHFLRTTPDEQEEV